MVRAAVEAVRSTLRPLMLRRHGSDLGDDGKPLLPLPPLTVHTFTLQLTYEERLFYQVRAFGSFIVFRASVSPAVLPCCAGPV